jgi:PEP-CTERM motif
MNKVQSVIIKRRVQWVATISNVDVVKIMKGSTMKKLLLAALAISAAFATPAAAVTFVGATTLTDPTFNRPLAGLTGLSGVGTAVHYKATTFTVAASGSYSFLMTGAGAWDTFLILYSPSFNPATGLVNALIANDDFPSIGVSGFTTSLLAGTSYVAITTGFGNSDVGEYTLEINQVGAGAVPEPSTWAMIIAGFGIVGAALRRRRTLAIA